MVPGDGALYEMIGIGGVFVVVNFGVDEIIGVDVISGMAVFIVAGVDNSVDNSNGKSVTNFITGLTVVVVLFVTFGGSFE